MVCIYCSGNTSVVNSRPQKRSNNIWRRRSCSKCAAIFTTIESPDTSSSIIVKHADGSVTPFLRDKLFMSILKSLPENDQYESAAELSTTIIASLVGQPEKLKPINVADIIKTSQTVLRRYNKTAYLRYSAEYASESIRIK